MEKKIKVLQMASYATVDAFYTELFRDLENVDVYSTCFSAIRRGAEVRIPPTENTVRSVCYTRLMAFFLSRKAHRIANACEKNVDVASFDLIHAHTLYTNGVPAYYLSRKYGIPYIVTIRHTDTDVFPYLNFAYKSLIKKVLLGASKVLFVTPLLKKKAEKRFSSLFRKPSFSTKCAIIPNKASEFFYEHLGTPKKLDPTKGIEVLFVGRIMKVKMLPLLLERCAKVFGPKDRLTIVTSTPEFNEPLLGKYPFVNYVGKVPHDEIITYYRKADIFALLSKGETFGISYIEAMSQGTPVLYSRNEGIDGLFKAGEGGYAVDRDNEAEFIQAYNAILSDYENVSRSAIEASKKFRNSRVLSLFRKAYDEVLCPTGE